MKNFKKVISAVIALAMSISTFASASSFTDVADTHANAEAIDVLASLGIINGYEENGTFVFKPEGTITRAEAATMIVGALNMTEDAKASAGTSQFADVNTEASWAAGYVNVGVAQGFISGMDATTFAPQDNVTYAQMCVMLTSIAGYGDYAKSNGGYPTGYTNMAASTGINKGVAVGNDVALTRGQVAQMIWNTLQTPKLGVYEYSITGNSYSQLDGSSKVGEFKTLLSEKFDGYVVTATISETATSSSALETDTAKVTITKADWWGDADRKITGALNANTGLYDYVTETVILDGMNVNGALHQSGKAIITEDDFGDFHLVYFAVTGKTDTKEFAADDYVMQEDLGDPNQFSTANKKIRFGTRYFTLADSVDVYVNGALQDTITNEADSTATPRVLTTAQTKLDNYLGNAVGTITLIDADANAGYEKIMVDIYNIAKVAAVEYSNSETIVTITTREYVAGGVAYDEIVITDEAIEDGDTIMSVQKNGNEVKLTSLVKDDIIAYKADFKNNTNNTLKDPKEIEILATTDTVSGKVTGKDTDEDTYSIDGTAYKYVTGLGTLTVGESYTATLDPFGRIYSTEKDGTSAKMAIALEITSNDQLKLLLADGTTKSYDIASGATIKDRSNNDMTEAALETLLGNASTAADDRVVEYTVRTSSQEITKILFKTPAVDATGTAEEFNGRTNRIAGIEILSTTNVIDATDTIGGNASSTKKSASYSTFAADGFKDGADYKFAAWKSGTYTTLVVLTSIGNKFNDESRFAVVRKAGNTIDTEDGDRADEVVVLYNGDAEAKLLFNEGYYSTSGLQVGDAFFFETDNDGFVNKVFKVFDANSKTFTSLATSIDTALNATDKWKDYLADDSEGWDYTLVNSANKDIQLVEGYVVPGNDGEMTFAAKTSSALTRIDTTKDLKNDAAGVAIFSVDADCQAYLYDTKNTSVVKTYDKFKKAADVSVLASTTLAKYESNDVYTGTDMRADANVALAMIVNDVVVAVYVIK